MLPLVVALPLFFALYSLMQGWSLISIIEDGWDSGNGNVWDALKTARFSLWGFAAAGACCGLAWAWVILMPIKRYKAQIDRMVNEGRADRIVVEDLSEFSFLAASFNQLMEEVGKSLPQRVRSILGSVTSGVVLIDPNGRVERVNPCAARLLRMGPENPEGEGYEKALSVSEELVSLVRKALETQTDSSPETILMNDEYGGTRRVKVWLAWVRGQDGAPVTLVINLMDLTRLESFTSGLKTAERLTLLGNIARGIAHEVRNPLSSIRGLAQLLAAGNGPTPDKVRSYGEVMIKEVDRVDRVVQRLSILACSRSDERVEFGAGEVVETVFEIASHPARSKTVTLTRTIETPEPFVVGSKDLLVQAVLNVVVNGIEAVPEGGEVRVSVRRDGEKVLFRVENNGPSIPPGELDNVFQPFHTTKPNRSGLGLTITDSIVRDHGGDVEILSKGDRTIVTLSIPVSEGREIRPCEALPVLAEDSQGGRWFPGTESEKGAT